jgi:hypothetical protein
VNPLTVLVAVPTETVNPEEQQSLISGALPIAGLFTAILLIAVFFLWRSLRRQIGKIDTDLPGGPDDREQALDRRLQAEAVERGEEADGGQPGSSGT